MRSETQQKQHSLYQQYINSLQRQGNTVSTIHAYAYLAKCLKIRPYLKIPTLWPKELMSKQEKPTTATKPSGRTRIRAAHEKTILAEAEGVAISKTNLLYYFPTKHALYQSVLTNILDIWFEKLNLLNQGGEDPATKIESYIRDKLELSRNHPNASKVFANEIINGAPNISDYLQQQFNTTLKEDVDLINRWIDEGKMDAVDPYHLFFMIWACTQTYADFSTQIQFALKKKELAQSDFDTAADFLCQVILKGIGLGNS